MWSASTGLYKYRSLEFAPHVRDEGVELNSQKTDKESDVEVRGKEARTSSGRCAGLGRVPGPGSRRPGKNRPLARTSIGERGGGECRRQYKGKEEVECAETDGNNYAGIGTCRHEFERVYGGVEFRPNELASPANRAPD